MNIYAEQASIVLDLIPVVEREKDFALKGGTALNFFYLNIPRYSVDIDLCYRPVTDRNSALEKISNALIRVEENIKALFPASKITRNNISGNYTMALQVVRNNRMIKIEANNVIRGSIFPTTQILSPANLYG